MNREPVEATPRKAFSPKEKAVILAKSDGHCAYPGCAEAKGLEFDHIIMIWLGGKHSTENGSALCPFHHKQKTKLDAAIRARTKRIIKREAGEKKPTTIRSQGFRPGHRAIPSKPFPQRKKT